MQDDKGSRAVLRFALPFSMAGEGAMNLRLFIGFVARISDIQGRDSEKATIAFSAVSNTEADELLTGVALTELDGPSEKALGEPGKQDLTLCSCIYLF
jgi:hypothetical protein